MAFDLYVGGLVDYFFCSWETPGPDLHLEGGHGAVIKSNRRSWRSAGVDSVPKAVEAVQNWRSQLSEGFGLAEPLDWKEGSGLDYYTLRPGWLGYEGLLFWAAYEEAGEVPPAHLPSTFCDDPLLKRDRQDSKYKHLLDRTEIWLPGNWAFTFKAPDPTGRKTDFGFTVVLLDELSELNERTWKADWETVDQWCDQPVEEGASLEACARYGFAIFNSLAMTAHEKKLPMVCDY